MADINSAKTGNGVWSHIFSGTGIGLLVGIIVGMSVSPVVSVILGALASMLAAFLGLQGGGDPATEGEKALMRIRVNGIRIGSFGFACVAGILFGLFIRSHEVLSIPVETQVAKWTSAGYPEPEARQIVAFQKLGIKPQGRDIMISETQKAHSSSLFSNLTEIDLCNEISMERFGNDPEKTLRAYRRQDNEKLTAFADAVEKLPAENQAQILKAMEEVLCELQNPPSNQ